MSSLIAADFVVVQSAWGMTQGCVMPFSGFIIRAIGEKVGSSPVSTSFFGLISYPLQYRRDSGNSFFLSTSDTPEIYISDEKKDQLSYS
jgi:hypothetical protein